MIRPVDLKDDGLWAMFQACRSGDLDQVKTLVANRPDLACAEYNYTPPLHFAVREGHLSVVQFLLDHGADAVTYRTYPFLDSLVTMAQDRDRHDVAGFLVDLLSSRFPVMEDIAVLLTAARNGDSDAIAAALAVNPALVRGSNDIGDTALHQAVTGGHVDVMNALLDAGANVDAVRADGLKPVHCALRNHPDLVDTLLSRGAAYDIYLAAVLGDTAYVRDALARDSSLSNYEDSSHHRPISAAAARDDLDMVQLLLSHGANPSLPEHGAPLGQALWLAVYHQQLEIARSLLEHGANPNTAPESSGPAISHARNHPELEALLLQYGATRESDEIKRRQTWISDNDLARVEEWLLLQPGALEEQDLYFWGEGILSGPSNSKHRDMIELLLRHDARVPAVSKWGPEYYFKHAEIGALLLERGMNPNHSNWQHVTMLHHMAAKGFLPKTRLLVEHGASVNAIDEEYSSTPLGFAARWGHRDMVAYLLACGADPNLAGAAWATPLAWAIKKGHAEIANDLRNAGAVA